MQTGLTLRTGSRREEQDDGTRYHALDKLRWSMMALGLALHSATSYMRTPLGDLWPYQSTQTSFGFDVLVALIHVFRMPTFFVMAGFFGALSMQRYGPRPFVRNRLKRIGIPLILGWVLICPTTLAGFAFAQSGSSVEVLNAALRFPFSKEGLARYQFFHLWFLFDLLLYHALSAVVWPLTRQFPDSWKSRASGTTRLLIRSQLAPVTLAIVTAMTLAPMRSGMLETPGAFLRPWSTLLANAVFFVFGWALYTCREWLGDLRRRAWGRVVLASLAFAAHLFAVTRPDHSIARFHSLSVVSASLAIWLFVFALMGLYLRYGSRPNRLSRYAAEASYWSYIIHLPIVIWGTALLANVDVPIAIKFVMVLTGTIVVCISSYDAFVRPTWVGQVLSGERRPRGTFAPEDPGSGPT